MYNTSIRHRGFTLIELLLAITMGMVIVSVATSVLTSAVKGSVKIKDAAMLQETSFFTSHLIEQHLRQAGFTGIDSSLVAGRRVPVYRTADTFPEVENEWLQGQFLKSAENSIQVRFNGSSDSLGAADGSIIDCQGNAIAAGVLGDVTLSLVDGQLVCANDGVETVFAGSDDTVTIEQFLITLGVDDDDNGSIDRYVDSAAATPGDMTLTREVAIRVLMASNLALDTSERQFTFNNFDTDYTDNYFRRELVVRSALRNVAGL